VARGGLRIEVDTLEAIDRKPVVEVKPTIGPHDALRVRSAVSAGLTKHRVHHITGIGRSTIDRILARTPDAGCASTVPDRGRHDD